MIKRDKYINIEMTMFRDVRNPYNTDLLLIEPLTKLLHISIKKCHFSSGKKMCMYSFSFFTFRVVIKEKFLF